MSITDEREQLGMKATEQETRGLRTSRSAEKHGHSRQIVDGEIYEEGEEPTTYDMAKTFRRRLILIVATSSLIGLLLLLAGMWLFGPDLGFPRTYTYQWEGESWAEPSEEDAIRYARLALSERDKNPDEFEVYHHRSGSPGRWIVQFHISDEFFEKGRWLTVWNVWLEFREDEVEARIAAPL